MTYPTIGRLGPPAGRWKASSLQWRLDLGWGGSSRNPCFWAHVPFLPLAVLQGSLGSVHPGPCHTHTGGQRLLIEIPGTGPEPSLAEVGGGPPPPEAGPVSGKPASQKAPTSLLRRAAFYAARRKRGSCFHRGWEERNKTAFRT